MPLPAFRRFQWSSNLKCDLVVKLTYKRLKSNEPQNMIVNQVAFKLPDCSWLQYPTLNINIPLIR